MKNNTEKQIKTPRTIKLGDVEIYENGAENETAAVELNIPFRFHLCGRRKLSEYKQIALEDLRIKASTFFELTEFLGELMRDSGDYRTPTIIEFILLLSTIGKGLAEASEVVENEFDSYANSQQATIETNEQPSEAQPKEARTQRQRKALEETAVQLEMAFTSDDTDDSVKECLKTIIWEISGEAGLTLGDLRLVRYAYPNIIEALDFDYGCGVHHSINAILRYNTKAFEEFHAQNLDEKRIEETASPLDLSAMSAKDLETDDLDELASQLSAAMSNPKMPRQLYNSLSESLTEIKEAHSPENILFNLQMMNEKESQ